MSKRVQKSKQSKKYIEIDCSDSDSQGEENDQNNINGKKKKIIEKKRKSKKTIQEDEEDYEPSIHEQEDQDQQENDDNFSESQESLMQNENDLDSDYDNVGKKKKRLKKNSVKKQTNQHKSQGKNERKNKVNQSINEERQINEVSQVDKNQEIQQQFNEMETNDQPNNNNIQLQDENIELNFEFLLPDFLQRQNLKDAQMRSIDDPDYDCSTVYVPNQFLEKQSAVYKQYWKSKSINFDKIMFIRFGRQFMCFQNDAVILAKLFDIPIRCWGQNPFVNVWDCYYPFYVKTLISKGYKCAVLDQIEFWTHRAENQEIAKREITQIITAGTYTDYDDNQYNPRFLVSIIIGKTFTIFNEELQEDVIETNIGICAVDCTTHEFYLDQFNDDKSKNQLRTILRKLMPVEILLWKKNANDELEKLIKSVCKNCTCITKYSSFDFQSLNQAFQEMQYLFSDQLDDSAKNSQQMSEEIANNSKDNNEEEENIQETKKQSTQINKIQENQQQNKNSENDLQKQQLIQYPSLLQGLEELYIDELKKDKQQMNSNQQYQFEDQNFQFYWSIQSLILLLRYLKTLQLENIYQMGNYRFFDSCLQQQVNLFLDSQAIDNLDIFQSTTGIEITEKGSLLDYVNYTKTQFGKRLLRKWLSSPLKQIEKIIERQICIEDLINNDFLIDEFQKQAEQLPDIERKISKVFNSIQKSRLCGCTFDNFSQTRLKEFYQLIQDLKNLESCINIFQDYLDEFKSDKLKALCTFKQDQEQSAMSSASKESESDSKQHNGKKKENVFALYLQQTKKKRNSKTNQIQGIFPKINLILQKFEQMLEKDSDGSVIPRAGCDSQYDICLQKINKVHLKLIAELEKWKKVLNCNDIKYVHTKYRYQLDVPESAADIRKRPKEFNLTSKTKTTLRFQTQEIEQLVFQLKQCEGDLSNTLVPFIQSFIKKFFQYRNQWEQAISCIAQLDCLCSLAKCSMKMGQHSCQPIFKEDIKSFELLDMYHPCLKKAGYEMVSNDTIFDEKTELLLVTGPNMGGKSTLLRQTCLAVILAQLGCYVPAKQFTLHPIDRIFCRIGANDSLLEGKSTFYVEMEETAQIVKNATEQSLVILDELGRGTSTFDGVSIAYGVLKYLVEKLHCKTLFSTHYHLLLDEFRLFNNIKYYVMQYEFNSQTKEILFHYKFIQGEADRSFGLNVAKSVGIQQSIIKKAEVKEQEMNSEAQQLGFVRTKAQQFNLIIQQLLSDQKQQKKIQRDILTTFEQLNL